MAPMLGIMASSISGNLVTGSYESISTTTVTSAVASVTFSSIPATYQHLQIRMINRGGTSANIRVNSDTGASYTRHYLQGNGTSATSVGTANATNIDIIQNTTTASLFAVNIIDLLDYANTNKSKTFRIIGGKAGSISAISSGMWMGGNAITTIQFNSVGGNFAQYSTFALYGIKG